MYLLPSWIGSKLASCSGLDFMTFFEQRLQQNARSQVTSVTKMSRSINMTKHMPFCCTLQQFLETLIWDPKSHKTGQQFTSQLLLFWLFTMFIYALGCKSVHGSSYFLTKGLDRFALTNLVQCAGALAMEFIQYDHRINKGINQAAHLDRLRWPGLEVGQGCQRTRVEKCWKASWWQVIECRSFLTAARHLSESTDVVLKAHRLRFDDLCYTESC